MPGKTLKKAASVSTKGSEYSRTRKKAPPSTDIAPNVSMPPEFSEPLATRVYSRVRALQERYARRRAIDDDLETLYYLRQQPPRHEGVETIVSSKAFDAVNTGVDTMTTYSPSIEVNPLNELRAAKDEAEDIAEWLKSSLYKVQRTSKKPIIYSIFFHAFLHGRFLIRALLIDDPEEEQFPIRIQVRNPKYIYPAFDEDGRLWELAEVFQRRAEEVKRLYPNAPLKPPQDIARKGGGQGSYEYSETYCEWAEYWDRESFYYFVNGHPVAQGKHEYGTIPYVFGYGRAADSDRPEEEAISLLYGARYTLPEYNLMNSAKATAAVQYLNSALLVTSERADNMNLDLGPGAVNYLFPGEDVKYLARQGGNMPDVNEIIEALKGELSTTTLGSLIGGIGEDTRSGFAISQISRGEKQKLNPVKMNVEWALAELMQLILRLAEIHGKAIEVVPPRQPGDPFMPAYSGPIKLTPSMARKYKKSEIFVTVPPDYLEDQQVQMSLALQSTAGQDPVLDKETARKRFLHIADTTQVKERILAETIEKLVIGQWAQYVLQRKGIVPPQGPGVGGQGAGGAPQQAGPPGNPQQPFSMPPNAGQPTPGPGASGIGPEMMPGAAAGIPPVQGGDQMAAMREMVQKMIGMGMKPEEAIQRIQAMGTPQATGLG